MAYRDIADAEVDSLSPVTESLMTALRDNPIGIAQRNTDAPRVQPPSIEVLDTVGSGTWTAPDGVTRVRVRIVGGGGGGSGNFGGGSAGGDSTFNDGVTTYTAGGGGGGEPIGVDNSADATNGDINLSSRRTGPTEQTPSSAGDGMTGYGVGGRAGPINGQGGAGGAVCVVNIDTSPGDSLAYEVGAVGAGGAGDGSPSSAPGEDGVQGVIILEY